ncbi:alpha/beta hydrolase (plasmid) [Rhodococcus erythropolis]|uniref:alpha/beta fold hydrolase n=1 Tax=Rhodococcus erythropolis TaxID=1833 RepID=UPI00061B5D3D|nr:alpha/beta fold hydrolase [Rhodococcus erythropolis]AKE01164.1 alpha/beta hydrolase [Rhodococcus erythropolis]
MPVIERPWGKYHYLDEGTGPLVVLLHPLAASGEIWRTLTDQLAPNFRVVAPDARGHGRSVWNGDRFTVSELAEDVAALIDHLGVGPAHVAALSMGGCTAIALAVRHPDQVSRLVLADTTADYGPEKESVWADRADKAVSVPRPQQLTFQVDRWFSPDFVGREPAEVDHVSKIFVATDSRAHAAACRALGSYSDANRLAEISAPTLILVGEDDYATPPAMAHNLREGIGESELHVLAQVRHMSLIESEKARELLRGHFE